MDQPAFYKIGYGLYVLTAREGEKDNGCIINTLIQVTDQPCRISSFVTSSPMPDEAPTTIALFPCFIYISP